MAQQLSQKDLRALRDKGLLTESETAFKDGEVIIAEDLVQKTRRILNTAGLILDANRQILHD